MTDTSRSMMKWPLLIAAALVVVRIVLEHLGAAETVNNIFGVAWLYFLVPVYFGIQIAGRGDPHPYRALFVNLLLFSLYTRLMVMLTYWLAYALQWKAPRFGLEMGGVVGEGVSPVEGYLWYPVRNALVWIIFATVLGMIIGGITLLIRRRGGAPATG